MLGVVQSAVVLSLVSLVVKSQNCNFIIEYPDDVCFKNPDADDQEKSRKYICVDGVPMRYDYEDNDECSGDPTDEREYTDDDDINYYCGADASCDYLKIESSAYTNDDCDEDGDEAEYTAENLRVVNVCVGNNNNTLYVCNEDQDEFYTCNCDNECVEQDEFELNDCDNQVIGSTINSVTQCPASTRDVEIATPSPITSAGCNFYDETPMDVCFEISNSEGLKSRKFVCDGDTPMRYTYSDSSSCSGTAKERDMSGEDANYECGNEAACDYVVIKTIVYDSSGSCGGSNYANSEARAIDACVGNGRVYKCVDDENNFQVCTSCDNGGDDCTLQDDIEFDTCNEIVDGVASSKAALQRCAAPASLLNVYHMMMAVVVSLAVMAA